MNIPVPGLIPGAVAILLQPKDIVIIENGYIRQSPVRKMELGAQAGRFIAGS